MSAPIVVDGTLFVAAGSLTPRETPGQVYALDAATGEQRWVVDVSGDPSWLTVVNETVFVTGTQDRVHALAAASGGTLWETQIDGSLRTAPTVADGTLVFASRNGFVYEYELGLDAGQYSDGSRARLGTLGNHGEWRYADQTIDIDESGTDDGGGDSGTDSGGGDSGTDDGDDGGGDDGLGPGLGPAAALAGLGGAGYLLRQRRDDGDAQ